MNSKLKLFKVVIKLNPDGMKYTDRIKFTVLILASTESLAKDMARAVARKKYSTSDTYYSFYVASGHEITEFGEGTILTIDDVDDHIGV